MNLGFGAGWAEHPERADPKTLAAAGVVEEAVVSRRASTTLDPRVPRFEQNPSFAQ